jgi:dipeptidyl aminopeptidase/acylaminoacyl peptidase
MADLNLAVRYIRAHAEQFHIDAQRIGITGGSAGGHLSLMQGLAGDTGDPQSKDGLGKVSSRVQAVACFFPPTDFLNYGTPGNVALGRSTLENFKAPFDFQEIDEKTREFVRITDEERILDIGRKISPINHVSSDDPPTLIIHGDADKLVPIQQAELVIDKLKEAHVPAELVVKAGKGHGWPNLVDDMSTIADWFDKYLQPEAVQSAK